MIANTKSQSDSLEHETERQYSVSGEFVVVIPAYEVCTLFLHRNPLNVINSKSHSFTPAVKLLHLKTIKIKQ